MVGAVLVKGGEVIGRGWHHRAGEPHAEIEALRDAQARGHNPKGATLYVTLEPCCTQGRTPPCTDAIVAAGIRRVVAGATDPNPLHSGRAFGILEHAGIAVTRGVLAVECERLNEAFNHWIGGRTPFVTVKAAMTLDGKIATASGESKWITGEVARAYGHWLRRGADAILVGINTVLADDPSLTVRGEREEGRGEREEGRGEREEGRGEREEGRGERGEERGHRARRVVLDSMARTPLTAKVVSDDRASLTTIVVSRSAPRARVTALAQRVRVLTAPVGGASGRRAIDLRWLLQRLGAEDVTSLLVEGGGEVNGSFLLDGLAHRVAFFYAPKILGGRDARRAVAGDGARRLEETLSLTSLEWRRLGPDWLLTARVSGVRNAECGVRSAE
jgi:diaminohydroxyphosphoribosylaminopyrimidine deaminase/5-amino-6-(5-phosphoribosylamino)uracil reductase